MGHFTVGREKKKISTLMIASNISDRKVIYNNFDKSFLTDGAEQNITIKNKNKNKK